MPSVGADLPVRHALVLAVGVGVVAHDAHDRVVASAGAVGRVVVTAGSACEQDDVELGRDVRNERFQLALGFSEGTALRLHRLRACDVAGLAERADLARQGLDPVAHVIALAMASRSRRSSSMARSMSPRSTDRRASAALTPSGSARKRRMSIMGRDGPASCYGRPRKWKVLNTTRYTHSAQDDAGVERHAQDRCVELQVHEVRDDGEELDRPSAIEQHRHGTAGRSRRSRSTTSSAVSTARIDGDLDVLASVGCVCAVRRCRVARVTSWRVLERLGASSAAPHAGIR